MKNLKKVKIFVDARFKPRLDFFSKIHSFAQELSVEYPDWETDGLKVSLKSKAEGKLILFSHDRVVFSWENNAKDDQVITEVNSVLQKYADIYGKLDFNWFGVRSRGFIKQDVTFDELVKLFHFRFHSTDLQQLEYFGENVTDDSFVANSTIDGWDYRFELGPCSKSELTQRLSSKLIQLDESTIPDLGIYFDIDTHYKNKVENQPSTLNNGLDNLNKAINSIKTFISPQD